MVAPTSAWWRLRVAAGWLQCTALMTVAGGAGADGTAAGEKVPVAPVIETRVALGLLLAPVRSDVRAQTT